MDILSFLATVANANLNSEMVYILINEATQWLNDRLQYYKGPVSKEDSMVEVVPQSQQESSKTLFDCLEPMLGEDDAEDTTDFLLLATAEAAHVDGIRPLFVDTTATGHWIYTVGLVGKVFF